MRRAWCAIAGAALAVLALFSWAQVGAAQGTGVLTVSVEDATARPVSITAGLGQITLIQVRAAPIVTVTASPPDIVHVVQREHAVLLIPVRLGRASVGLGLGGTTVATFQVTVSDGPGLHAVIVQPSTTRADTATAPRPPVDPPPTPAPLAPPAAPTPSNPQTPAAAPPSPRNPALPPRSSSTPVLAQRGVQLTTPPGVETTAVVTHVGGDLYISYVIQNRTGHPLTTDPRAVQVTPGSGGAAVRQIDIDTPGVVSDGAMETGVIMLHANSPRVTVTWALGAKGGRTTPLTIAIDAAALGPAGGCGTASTRAPSPRSAGADAGTSPANARRLVERVTMLVPTVAAAPQASVPMPPAPVGEPARTTPAAGSEAPPALPSPLAIPEFVPVTLDGRSDGWIIAKAQAQGGTVTVHYTIRNNMPWTTLINRGIIVTDAHGHPVPIAGAEAAALKPIPSGRDVHGVIHLPQAALPARIQWQWDGIFRTVWATSITIGQE